MTVAKIQFDRSRLDIQEALKLGWFYTGKTGSGHLCFRHPGYGGKLVLCNTRSEYRGTRNTIALIRKLTPRED
jgi:hypothetical protein